MLLVEPSKAHASNLIHTLQSAGFTVTHVESAEAALACTLGRPAFDLIVAEWKLPGQSGLGLLRRVRQACPDTVFFVITGQPEVAASVSALSLGAKEYLSKPMEEAHLVALCWQAVARAPRTQLTPSRSAPPRPEAPRDDL